MREGMKIHYERDLIAYMEKRKKKNISVEVASSNASDFEFTEIYLRLVSDDFASYLVNKKRYRAILTPVGQVLLPPYRLVYAEEITFGCKKRWLFHFLTYQGISL